jgi:alkanesulfonate monooxygenase SsuD/methylene tetrahydromethanopterin reductase-like flavin-dependent oxidoreductase (luciferase family)
MRARRALAGRRRRREPAVIFVAFHLMPYRPLDLAAAEKHRSTWVVLPNSFYDPVKGADEYESHLSVLADAERLGFDGIGVNEHHQTAYGLMPAPNLIASALIQRTRHIKIAILGRALPLVSNPLYIAEETAMLDNLSRGRIIQGLVRGIGAEYHASGVNPYFSHARFLEAHDLVLKAWTQPGPFAFEGEFFDFRYVNVWPRPYQQPHPPIWIPSQGSAETVAWAAAPERKYPFLVTFSGADLVVRYLTSYREQARKYGYEAAAGQLGWAAPVYVGDSDEQARREAGAAVESLFNNFLRMPWEMLIPPGYMSLASMQNFMRSRKALGSNPHRSADELIDSGTALIGSALSVRHKIAEMRERTGFGIMVPLLQFGTLDDTLTRRNFERFAAEVMPHFRKDQ